MFFYIKEWPDETATLMAKNGAVLWTFCSVEEAQKVWRNWYQINTDNIDLYDDEIKEECISLDPTCVAQAVA